YAEPGNRAKGYDTDGKDVGVLAVLRVGNVFDLVVQPGAAMGSVVEMRLVKRAELTSGQMKEMSHEGAVLVKALPDNAYLFKIGADEALIDATSSTKVYDTTLKEMPIARAMTPGAVLDLKTRKLAAQEFLLEAKLKKGENATVGAWTEVVAVKAPPLNLFNHG